LPQAFGGGGGGGGGQYVTSQRCSCEQWLEVSVAHGQLAMPARTSRACVAANVALSSVLVEL